MKKPQTYGWVVNYPLEKIEKTKDLSSLKTIKLPKVCALFLSQEDQEMILMEWQKRYGTIYKSIKFTR